MAKQTIVTLIDDVDGTEAAETVEFSLDGKSYAIDLSDQNAKALREALALYVAHGRKVGGSPGRRKPAKTSQGTGEMRRWLQAQGYPVRDRGRIPLELQEVYRQHVSGEEEGSPTPESAVEDTDDAPAEPTDPEIIAWHEAKGYKVKLDKEGRPNGLMRHRYLQARTA